MEINNKNSKTDTFLETQNNKTNTYIVAVDDGDEWSVIVIEYDNNNEKFYELYLRNKKHKYQVMYMETVSEKQIGTKNLALLNYINSIIEYKVLAYYRMLFKIDWDEYI